MTTHTTTTQLLLPGQAAAPEGPVDVHMMYVLHHAFRRDLRAFASAAAHTPLEERTTWRALSARFEQFGWALHHHHSGEDTGLWPLLRERSAPEDVATLDAMEAEHEEIDPLLTACAAGLTRLADHADEDARAALVVRLVAARESLGRHLAHEETAAMALVQRHLTQADWTHVEETAFAAKMSLSRVVFLVPWVGHELPDTVRDQLLADAPVAMRLIHRLTAGRFARRERAIFRYAA
ncbi:conserved hypothetical protein [Nostocoides japonicum T1-X7]|uniref:Hemerythrin-like domain-containing protein n=1 Tax=Nostocoides japonicum T1-X7 TaxID=1194083 RepID=A0A077LXR7_9MICO|nr:hemerythrin domain-containing protein [Tetrasphaera japonica]CCH76794.1 conserved hypothetical protein [Tetrasphaera japonica T1-X7]